VSNSLTVAKEKLGASSIIEAAVQLANYEARDKRLATP
jgi:hypothetical protein